MSVLQVPMQPNVVPHARALYVSSFLCVESFPLLSRSHKQQGMMKEMLVLIAGPTNAVQLLFTAATRVRGGHQSTAHAPGSPHKDAGTAEVRQFGLSAWQLLLQQHHGCDQLQAAHSAATSGFPLN